MAIKLPYEFDNTPVLSLVLRGVLGLLLVVVVPGILYSLFVSHDWTVVVQLVVISATVAYFGTHLGRHLISATGTITREVVVVWPVTLYGISLSGPERRYSMAQFRAVRVERIAQGASRQRERVSLMGRDGVPDILVARTKEHAGRTLGQELAAALSLEYREESAPY